MIADRAVVHSGRRFGREANAAYSVLRVLKPGLCVDAGAAVGRTVRKMLAASPASRVVAYEPFANNHPYFVRNVGEDPRVTLRPVAVADRAGREPFVVSKMVEGVVPGWAGELRGYSALGRLGEAGDKGARPVDVVTLDAELDEPVRFLKIDVQGAELRVLKGASNLMHGPGIDVVYVEFNGERGVLELLHAQGYVLFDCVYLTWPTRRYFRNWFGGRHLVPGWEIVDEDTTSMGDRAALVWPRVAARRFASYCAWFFANRLLRCGLQTDLLCVHARVLPRILAAFPEG
jgi:FkbM family methyltransferase